MAENVVIKDTRARLARVLKRVNAIEAIEAQMGIDRLVNPDVTEKQEVTTKVTEQSEFEDTSEKMRNKEDHTDASSSPGANMALPHRDFLLTRATSDIGKLMAARKVNNRELRVRHALGTIRASAIGTQVRPDLEANKDVQGEENETKTFHPGFLFQCLFCWHHCPPSEIFEMPCGSRHHICHDCLERILKEATHSQKTYPARCCSFGEAAQPLDLECLQNRPELMETIEHMPKLVDIMEKYKLKAVEWETLDRTYCAKPHCAKFLNPRPATEDHVLPTADAENGTLYCEGCKINTCVDCKSEAHPGHPCPRDPETEMVKQLELKKGGKFCPTCNLLVGKEEGGGCNRVE
jgi:hypothetical protein